MAFKVNTDDCINCAACRGECPVECITEVDGHSFVNADECIDCGACADVCPVDCINPA